MEKSPIEILQAALEQGPGIVALVEDVLVPEQCMSVWINGAPYHVTVEPLKETSCS